MRMIYVRAVKGGKIETSLIPEKGICLMNDAVRIGLLCFCGVVVSCVRSSRCASARLKRRCCRVKRRTGLRIEP